MIDLGFEDPDIVDVMQNLADRVSDLEGTITSPDIMTGPLTDTFPGGITIGTTPVVGTIPTAPTAIVVSPSTHFDDIVADVTWTPAVGTSAVEYQVEIAWKLAGVYQSSQFYRTGGNQIRVVALRPDSTYGVRVFGVNRIGQPSATPYPAAGFQDFTTTHDTTIPALLTGLTVTAGVRSIVAVWAEASETDVKSGNGQYELEIATNSGFTTGVRSKFFGGNIGGFTDLTPQTQYWARVRSIDETGNPGPYTAGASATTAAVATGDFAVNTIDATVIADATILTAKIGNLQVTDAKINTMIVSKLTTGNLTSNDIVLNGGNIKTASLAPGIVLNSQGLSLYNASAVRTVFLDGATGAATFTGTVTATAGTIGGFTISSTELSGSGIITGGLIRTASTGQRLELNPASSPHSIKFETGNAGQTLAGFLSISGVTGQLTVLAPSLNSGTQAVIQLRPADGGTAGFASVSCGGGLFSLTNTTGLSVADAYVTNVYATSALRTTGNNAHADYGGTYETRIGELYGNGGVYVPNTVCQLDSGSSHVYLSIGGSVKFQCNTNGYNYSYNALSMQSNAIYLKGAGDTTHRIYWHSSDGVYVESYDRVGCASHGVNSMELVGQGGVTAIRSVDVAISFYRNHEANSHNNMSDPRFKKDIVPLSKVRRGLAAGERHLDKVKAIKPIKFKWRKEADPDPVPREHFGFDASELPPEVVSESSLVNSTIDTKPKLVNTLGMVALLWQAVRELTEEVDDLKLQLASA